MKDIKPKVEQLYESLPVACVLFGRDDDGGWSLLWQNASAISVWQDFEIDDHPMFKLELMEVITKNSSSSFDYQLPNLLNSYQFIAIPFDGCVLVQFFPKQESTSNDLSCSGLYQKVVESASLGVFDWDIEEDQFILTPRVYEIIDVSSAQLEHCYQSFLDMVYPEDVGLLKEAIEGHLATDWPLSVEFRMITGEHYSQWVQIQGQAEWSNDLPVRLTGSIRDISERKHTELELKQREALIEQMIDALPISIYVKDAQGCYRFFNAEAENQTNKLRTEVIGRTDYEVYPMPVSMKKAELDKSIQLSEKLSIFEAESEDKDQEAWLLFGKIPIQVMQSNRPYEIWLLSFSLDISDRKAMEEELKEARAIAEDAAKAKADFLSVMSHEIRTPLNSVIGNAGLLLSDSIDPEMAEHVEMIKRSGEHLLYLINDILDFNKLEAGKVELDLQPFDLKKQVDTVIDMSSTNAKLRNIYLKSDIYPDAKQNLLGDEGRLRQVLLNLVGNAVKFTSEGGVTVKVYQPRYSDAVRFEVIDTGIGIAAENIPKLFSEFAQAESSTSKKYGGTGLGLAISKKLVEAMNGKIGIESKEGEGSTFWFEIPFQTVEGESTVSKPQDKVLEDLTGLSILVAEDNLPNQFLIKSILGKLGHEVTLANDGLEAWNAINDQDKQFDLVLMDMQMPNMDGLEATQKIRNEASETVSSIPVIALTANAYDDVYDTVIGVGMNDCLIKPVNIDQLKQTLNTWGASKHS